MTHLYVAAKRRREAATLFYAHEDFGAGEVQGEGQGGTPDAVAARE